MNTEQARAFVKETFPQTFNKGRFRNFAINLLNNIDESKAQAVEHHLHQGRLQASRLPLSNASALTRRRR